MIAKLWTVRDGQSLMSSLGCSHVSIKLNTFVIVSFLISCFKAHLSLRALVEDCKQINDALARENLGRSFCDVTATTFSNVD
jgi:hypothetical protein